MEYKSIREKTTELLDTEVNQSLEEGWCLFGTPFYTGYHFVQPMTRGTDKPKNHVYRIDLKDCKNAKEMKQIQEAFLKDRIKIYDGNDKLIFKFNKD